MVNKAPHMKTACVTGASGMIGLYVAKLLVDAGYNVRVLTRKRTFPLKNVKCFYGGLDNEIVLSEMLENASIVFHCAAELLDEKKMYSVNVKGSECLMGMAINKKVKRFVYISSAGVVGPTQKPWVDEDTECRPSNAYEISKWQAEQVLIKLAKEKVKLCILRPLNVVDDDKPGVFSLVQHNSWKNTLSLFVKGGEVAHVVHAFDVAAAALFLAERVEGTFFVGCDEDLRNTVGGLAKVYKDRSGEGNIYTWHMPIWLLNVLRRLLKGKSLHGSSRFSSKKLLAEGFVFPFGVNGTVDRLIMQNREGR